MELYVKYFGEPKVFVYNEEVVFPFAKAEALLYYILIVKKASREKLIDLLWPYTSEENGRHNLRNAIYTLRQVLGPDVFDKSQRTYLEIDKDFTYVTDYHLWLQSPHEGAEKFRGCFLEGVHVKKADGYNEWVLELRRSAQVTLQTQLREQIQQADANRAYGELIQLTQQFIQCDEYDEWAWQKLMLGYKGLAQYKEAIRTYKDLETLFREELSIEPDKETQAIYNALITQRRNDNESRVSRKATKLFAREREQELIEAAMDQFLMGSASKSYLIVGETGIGKTILMQQLMEKAKLSPAYCIESCCYAPDAESFMKVWYVIIEQLMNFAMEEHIPLPEKMVAQIMQYFPGILTDTQGVVFEKQKTPVMYDSSSLVMSIRDMIMRLGQEARIYLFIDDIQWADQISLRILKEILEFSSAHNLMLIASAREGMDPIRKDFMHELGRADILHQLTLERLDFEKTCEFVKKNLPSNQVSQKLLKRIFDETEGNFLFISEYVNLLKENADSFTITPKIKDVLHSRLRDISDHAGKILNFISVFFDYAELNVIKDISTMEEEQLVDALEELCAKALIQESVNQLNEIRYSFNHQKVRNFVYEQLSVVKRRLFHGRVADVLVRLIQDNGYDRYAYSRIIYHLERCGNDKEVLRYRMEVLKDYLDISHEVFPVIEEGRNQLVTLLTLDEAMNEFAYMKDTIKRLQSNYPADVELTSFEIMLLHMEGRYHIQIGESKHGIQCVQKMIYIADSYNRLDMKLEGLIQWIYYGINTYDTDLMETKLKEAEALAVTLNDTEKVALLKRLRGCFHVMNGNYKKAVDHLQISMALFNELLPSAKYAISIAASINYLGDIHLYQGQWDEAMGYHLEALRRCREKGVLSGSAVCLVKLGIASYEKGDYGMTAQYLSQAQELYGQSNMIWLKHVFEGYLQLLSYQTQDSDSITHYLSDPTVIEKLDKWRLNPLANRLLKHICQIHSHFKHNGELSHLETPLQCHLCQRSEDCTISQMSN